jgi:hypothetical protein
MLEAFRSLEMPLFASSVRFDSDGALPLNPTEEVLVGDFLAKFPVPEVELSVLGTDSSVGLILLVEDIRAPRFGVGSAADPLGDALKLKALCIRLEESFLPPKEVTLPAGSLMSLQYMVTYRVRPVRSNALNSP